MDTSKFEFDQLDPASQAVIIGSIEKAIGVTVPRAAEFLVESRTEHPEKDEAWHETDAVGKFKHFLRVDHRWQGAVDAAWHFIEPYAKAVVSVALVVETNTANGA